MEYILELAKWALQTYPWFSVVVMIVGFLRLLIKPLMTIVQTYVATTPSKEDDKAVEGFFASKSWQTFIFILDWFASVKIKK